MNGFAEDLFPQHHNAGPMDDNINTIMADSSLSIDAFFQDLYVRPTNNDTSASAYVNINSLEDSMLPPTSSQPSQSTIPSDLDDIKKFCTSRNADPWGPGRLFHSTSKNSNTHIRTYPGYPSVASSFSCSQNEQQMFLSRPPDSGFGGSGPSLCQSSVYDDGDQGQDISSVPSPSQNNAAPEARPASRAQRPRIAARTPIRRQSRHIRCPEPNCGYQVTTMSEFKKHKQRHARPFRCGNTGCNQSGFATQNDLDRHLKTVHGDLSVPGKRYLCTLGACLSNPDRKIWSRADNFRQHLKKLHQYQFESKESRASRSSRSKAEDELSQFEVVIDNGLDTRSFRTATVSDDVSDCFSTRDFAEPTPTESSFQLDNFQNLNLDSPSPTNFHKTCNGVPSTGMPLNQLPFGIETILDQQQRGDCSKFQNTPEMNPSSNQMTVDSGFFDSSFNRPENMDFGFAQHDFLGDSVMYPQSLSATPSNTAGLSYPPQSTNIASFTSTASPSSLSPSLPNLTSPTTSAPVTAAGFVSQSPIATLNHSLGLEIAGIKYSGNELSLLNIGGLNQQEAFHVLNQIPPSVIQAYMQGLAHMAMMEE